MIPVSVLITTYNEEQNIDDCLQPLSSFDEVIVIDSKSTDRTIQIAQGYGAAVIEFQWNGQYPKKRQWCLDNVETKNDFIFFLDADERVTPEFIEELKNLDFKKAGYFVKAAYLWKNKILKYGLQNKKLVLFDRQKIEFTVVEDLDIEGMGEMEGHYQPILKEEYRNEAIGTLQSSVVHDAYSDSSQWQARHARYAKWESKMMKRNTYPRDVSLFRNCLKVLFRELPCRGVIAFTHSYVLKLGFMDGRAGYKFALSRKYYYDLVAKELRNARVETKKETASTFG